MAMAKRNLFDVADLVDDHAMSTNCGHHAAKINRLNGKPYSARYYEILGERRRLPVWPMKDEFLHKLGNHQVIVLHGETGGGKTTQIPQFVLQAHGLGGRPKVACTQPWRVAAMSAARRVAEEMDVTLGEEVGYSIPFEDCSSDRTVIKYICDDMLVRQAMSDPVLKEYNVIVLDEAQERTISTDLLLFILKDILKIRADLKVVVISGSHDEAIGFLEYFWHSRTLPRLMKVPHTIHHVEIIYSQEAEDDYTNAAISKVVQTHILEPSGDILLFLPQEFIEQACEEIEHTLSFVQDQCGPYIVIPLYSNLPTEMHHKVFQPAPAIWRVGTPPVRKIVVSSQIAESSVVIDGIGFVIDSGFFNQQHYDPMTGVEVVMISPVSKERAWRRCFCAGRTRPGKCFRLYPENTFNMQQEEQTYPDMVKSNLVTMVLTLMRLGFTNLVKIDYKDAPAPQTLMRALDLLYQLGALDKDANLTIFGSMMSEFPLDPELSTMILKSQSFHCANEILSISAMLSVPRCFLRPWAAQEALAADEAHARFRHIDGDHLTLLNVYQAYKQNNHDPRWCADNFLNKGVLRHADSVRETLLNIMTRLNCQIGSPDISNPWFTNNFKMAVLSGFFMQVAHLEPVGNYRTVKYNQAVRIDAELDQSGPEWVMFNEYVFRGDVDNIDIRTVTVVTAEMLIEVARRYYDLRKFPDSEAKRAIERMFISWFTHWDPKRFHFLNHRPYPEVTEALETLQWSAEITTEVAPPA